MGAEHPNLLSAAIGEPESRLDLPDIDDEQHMTSNAPNPKRYASASSRKPILAPDRESQDQSQLRGDTIRLLSYLPYTRCGATAEMLAQDAFGGNGDAQDKVQTCLLYAVSRMQIDIDKGKARDGKQEYWLSRRRDRETVEALTNKLIDAEFEN